MATVKVKVQKTHKDAIICDYKHTGDICFDIGIIIHNFECNEMKPKVTFGSISEESDTKILLLPNSNVIFHTGLKFEIEEGYGIKIHARSSTGIKKHLMMSNTTGIIDNGYRGEVLIGLFNYGDTAIEISNKDCLIQCEIVPINTVSLQFVDKLSETSRGEGGIGSTDKK